MPRLRQVPRAELTDPLTKSVYQNLFGDRDPVAQPGTAMGTPGHWWTVLAQTPHVLQQFVMLSRMYMGDQMHLDPRLRELGQTRAGWLNGCQFVYSQHCKMSRTVGLTDQQIDAVKEWPVATCFDERERVVLAYVDCLVSQRGRVPEGIFEALRSHLSEPAIIELTYVVCAYDGFSVLTKALRLEFDDRDDATIEVAAPESYEGGTFMGEVR